MKRIISLVLGIVMLLSLSVTAFATEITGDSGSGSVEITYTYEAPADSYIVTIPDSMTIGTGATVSATDVAITAGYLLTVSVSSREGWKLVNGDDALGYTLKIDGADIQNNATVLTAKNGDSDVTKTLVPAISDTVTPKYSGNYTDTLTFSVSVAECEHTYTYTDNGDGTHDKVCTVCSYVEVDNESHTFDASEKCLCGAIQITITDVNAPNDADHPFGDGWSNDEEEGLDSGASIGTQDVGKTAWAEDDQIIVTLISETIGTQTCVLTYDEGNWTLDGSFVYAEGETPTVTAVYAPSSTLGMGDYIPANCTFADGSITINFNGVTRNYSRLRIAGMANQTLTVTTTGFTPAGATTVATEAYTLTTDDNGNAFLYGTFAVDATVSVKYGTVTLAEFTFSEENGYPGTEKGKSYALDARPIIDGTLGGKDTATEEDIEALVEQLKAYVNSGNTTITVTGSNPATYSTRTAIGEAIYRLSGSGTHSADNPYNGKIDLILSDVTEIVDYEFQNAYALNSITLLNVTKLGDSAFYDCQYLKEITFSSVVTEGSVDTNDFYNVGTAVGGCDLVLHRGQENAATEYKPDLNSWTWWKTQWNYIELI